MKNKQTVDVNVNDEIFRKFTSHLFICISNFGHLYRYKGKI